MSDQYKVVQDLSLYPETQVKGNTVKVLDTYINLKWLLAHFKAEIKHNSMSLRREISIPGHFIYEDDSENSALFAVHYLSTINGMPTKLLDQHLDTIAYENAYHPIVECIKNNPWDGTLRLDAFIKDINTTNNELSKELITTWMVAAIAAAHSKHGFANQGVLVLQGNQGIGKTRLVKALDPIGCDAVREGALLDPTNKDCILILARHWINELGELDATFKKVDIARIKSYITSSSDDIRLPYARRVTRLARRNALIATVNDESFLSDDTGNRRWWTISILDITFRDWDMQQIWSEVYNLYMNGHLTYLTDELQLIVNEMNKTHEKIEPLQEKLDTLYDWANPNRRRMTATQVLEEMDYKNINRSQSTKMGMLIKLKTGLNPKKSNGSHYHLIPPKFYAHGYE